MRFSPENIHYFLEITYFPKELKQNYQKIHHPSKAYCEIHIWPWLTASGARTLEGFVTAWRKHWQFPLKHDQMYKSQSLTCFLRSKSRPKNHLSIGVWVRPGPVTGMRGARVGGEWSERSAAGGAQLTRETRASRNRLCKPIHSARVMDAAAAG